MKKILLKINKEKIFNVLIILVVIALYISVALLIYSNFRERKRQEIADGILNKVDEQISQNQEENTNNEASVNYGGYNYNPGPYPYYRYSYDYR